MTILCGEGEVAPTQLSVIINGGESTLEIQNESPRCLLRTEETAVERDWMDLKFVLVCIFELHVNFCYTSLVQFHKEFLIGLPPGETHMRGVLTEDFINRSGKEVAGLNLHI